MKTESDIEFQKRNLEQIFNAASMAPVFKENPKYNIDKFANLIPYISYDDVMDEKYIIRGRPLGIHNSFYSGKEEIIIEYLNIDELVNDGWRLD